MVIIFLIRIYRDEGRREFIIERWKRVLLVLYFTVLFILTIVAYCIFAYNSQDYPILLPENFDEDGFFILLLVIFIMLGLSIVMTILLYLGIICQCRDKTFMWRNILFLSYSFFYIIIIFVAMFSLSLVPHNYLYGSEGLIFVSYSYCNLYVYVLQYMYYTREEDLVEALQRE